MYTATADAKEATASWLGDVTQEVRSLLANHPHFRGRANTFEFYECDQVLHVRGQVPSFYLKQVLQTALRDVNGIRRVDNRVDVVCPDGLSSVRRR
jgi:hypothetical protein